jgi:hypothetical protein
VANLIQITNDFVINTDCIVAIEDYAGDVRIYLRDADYVTIEDASISQVVDALNTHQVNIRKCLNNKGEFLIKG